MPPTRRPEPEPAACGACPRRSSGASRRTWSWSRCALGDTLYEPGEQSAARVLPDDRHRLAALRAGVRGDGRDRRRRQRRHGRHCRSSWAATPRRARPWCRPAGHRRTGWNGRHPEAGVQPRRPAAAPAAALHAGADDADDPDRGVQPAPLAWSSACAAGCCWRASTELPVEETGDDPRTGRRHARRAPGGRHGSRRAACSRPAASATAAATSRCSTGQGSRPARASATPWSGRKLRRLRSDVQLRRTLPLPSADHVDARCAKANGAAAS